MNIVAIVQARLGSTRLPGKVLLDLAGKPVLARVLDRLSRAKRLNKVVVAATVEVGDDPLEWFCKQHGWPCFRGSQNNVLDRYYQTAKAFQADVIVRITSDCPLIEPEIVDCVVARFVAGLPDVDYVSNVVAPRTYPRGLDTEVFSFSALDRTWTEAKAPRFREHVTLYTRSHPEIFRIRGLTSDVDYSHMRWVIDTKDDLEFVRRIYEHIGNDEFSWRDVLVLLENHPEWLDINKHVRQKEW